MIIYIVYRVKNYDDEPLVYFDNSYSTQEQAIARVEELEKSTRCHWCWEESEFVTEKDLVS